MPNNAEALAFQANQRAAATAALERMPSTVSIGPHEFALAAMHGTVGQGLMRFGQCHTSAFLIEINETIPSPSQVVETVLHEIMHAIYWNACIYQDDTEERLVAKVGGALTDLCLRNPALLDWIRETLHGQPSPTLPLGTWREMQAGTKL